MAERRLIAIAAFLCGCNAVAGLDGLIFGDGAGGGTATGTSSGTSSGTGTPTGTGSGTPSGTPSGTIGADCGGIDVIATGQGTIGDIDVKNGIVYWVTIDNGNVMSCAATGCNNTPTMLTTTGSSAHYSDVDDTHIYWNNNSAGRIYSCPLTGCMGTHTVLATVPNPTRVGIDSLYVYWHSNDNTLERVDKAGTAIDTLIVGSGDSGEVLSDGSHLYWTERSNDLVRRCDLSTSPPCALASVEDVAAVNGPRAMAIDGTYAYYGGGGSLYRVAKTGGTPVSLADGQSNIHTVRVIGTHVYWINNDPAPQGIVRKVEILGGTPENVVDNLDVPRSFAVEGNCIYIGETGTGNIIRAPR